MNSELQEGLYDRIVLDTERTAIDELSRRRLVADITRVEKAELPDRVAELVAQWVRQYLTGTPESAREQTAIEVVAAATQMITHNGASDNGRMLSEPIERLLAVEPLDPTGREALHIARPRTPLRDTVLMTNARGEASVGSEIEAEIESAEQIDVVMAFIRWTGIRSLLPQLRCHVERGGQVRVVTTIYTTSTEQRALEALVEAGAQVKVSYDTSITRLHAKAWLFSRPTGFSTVYIGSSNLTHSAQVDGVEWNVRASQRRNPELVEAFERTFETYWADPHYEPFDPTDFEAAVAFERTRSTDSPSGDTILTPFDITPYPFQRRMLDQLALERSRGHRQNLVVAATGTGKTVLAALDYRRLRSGIGRSRLLFVAHRSEILRQSQATFRHVLRDGAFGERWVDGDRPGRWEHVFASIQSINASDVTAMDPTQFDVVIVDEFHHAAADSYQALLDHLEPQELIGLTATPERTDGLPVLNWFDGRTAVELRLWDALEQGLLSPFHYFGVHDGTDLSSVTWRRGRGYDPAELTNVYTADHLWTAKVLAELRHKVVDPTAMRALGFCVGIDHAEFMAQQFNRAGITAAAVTSRTSAIERHEALAKLAAGTINILFTVDLFNEGVDVPSIDVVLMLRPTESATVFLQQLGRGLRRAEGKDVLTVLDFVGHQSTDFRFDLRFRRLLGRSRREARIRCRRRLPVPARRMPDRARSGGPRHRAAQHRRKRSLHVGRRWFENCGDWATSTSTRS